MTASNACSSTSDAPGLRLFSTVGAFRLSHASMRSQVSLIGSIRYGLARGHQHVSCRERDRGAEGQRPSKLCYSHPLTVNGERERPLCGKHQHLQLYLSVTEGDLRLVTGSST